MNEMIVEHGGITISLRQGVYKRVIKCQEDLDENCRLCREVKALLRKK